MCAAFATLDRRLTPIGRLPHRHCCPVCYALSSVDATSVASLRNLRAGKHADLYSKLVDLFRVGSTKSLAELRSALAMGDLKAAAGVCHKLASSAANVGALAFAKEVRLLGQMCNAGNGARRGGITGQTRGGASCPARGVDAPATSGERVSETAQAGPLAIIADDEELGRLLLAESATETGLEPLVFDNGLAALDAALSQETAIILLDVDMPGMDGYTVCRRLRAEQRLATVPIVMVTGHEDAAAISRAFEAGATDFISKPVNWALLPRRIEYILRNAAAARALAERVSQVHTLVEAIPDTLWVVTPDGNIQWSPTTVSAAAQYGGLEFP